MNIEKDRVPRTVEMDDVPPEYKATGFPDASVATADEHGGGGQEGCISPEVFVSQRRRSRHRAW